MIIPQLSISQLISITDRCTHKILPSAITYRSHFVGSSHNTIRPIFMLALCCVMQSTNGHGCIFFHQQLQKIFAHKRPRPKRRRTKPNPFTVEHNADVYRECAAMYRADMWYTKFRMAFWFDEAVLILSSWSLADDRMMISSVLITFGWVTSRLFPKQISSVGVLAVLIESPWRCSLSGSEGVG